MSKGIVHHLHDQASKLSHYLRLVLSKGASDLHLTVGSPPQLRVGGFLTPVGEEVLTPTQCSSLCFELISHEQRESLEKNKELDFAFEFEGLARFRVNLFYEKGNIAVALRHIPSKIPSPDELGLPGQIMELTKIPRGLVLVTGPTGSGKSTTLAAMINRINETRKEHIITIEDPIEFVHESKKSLIVQREVEKDTHSFGDALKRVLRQDPDVVLIGEMRDLETIATALIVSETGHLVFATLHTNTAAQTINRIIDVFSPHQQPQIRTQLSFILQGILSQQLLPKKGGGRVLAVEILIPTIAIRNLIRENKIHQIPALMEMDQAKTGMISMDQYLARLCKGGMISREMALSRATDAEELSKMIGG